jgi:hypothetical protein
MYGEPALPVTSTNSGNEAKGTIMGLEGMAVVPVLFSAVASILLVVVLVMGSAGGAMIPRILFALSPVGCTVAYVLLFIHKKPPNYQRDSMELWRGRVPVVGKLLFPAGVSFNVTPLRRGEGNPLLRAKSKLAAAENQLTPPC